MIVLGNEVLFSGLDAAGHSGLWVTDGTADGTRELLAEAPGTIAGKDAQGLSYFTVFDGEVFFSASTSSVAGNCGRPTE
jgi:ELWxxDGT repeat protein